LWPHQDENGIKAEIAGGIEVEDLDPIYCPEILHAL